MNTLSWLIYLADVADNLDWLFQLLTVACGLFIAGTIISLMAADNFSKTDWRRWRVFLFGSIGAFVASIILGSAVPSKETVYAIAASEMGERALQTDTGGRAFKALNSWLDRQIDGPEKKDDNNEGS